MQYKFLSPRRFNFDNINYCDNNILNLSNRTPIKIDNV